MDEPLENLYFNWLYAKVCDPMAHSPSKKFETLLGELHRIEYVYLVSGDDNRAEDGLELRLEFEREYSLFNDVGWGVDPCSVLEMLIALSRRAAFDTDEEPSWWFWKMLENLGLSDLHDGCNIHPMVIQEALSVFLWRQYDSSGHGGIFPLLRSRNDQRKSQVWYQMSEYLLENDFG